MITKLDITRIVKQFEFLPNNPVKDKPERLNALIDAFYDTLKDLSLDLIQSAASAYMASGQFFPTPGNLRGRAVDIALLTMGIPTPGEAWGMIMTEGTVRRHLCERGARLADAAEGKTGRDYWTALNAYNDHFEECQDCYMDKSNGWNPAVKNAFEAMGGDHAIFTDNPSADRARFTDGYRAFVEREVLRFSMPSEVHGYIEDKRALLASGKIRQLSDTLSIRNSPTGEIEILE